MPVNTRSNSNGGNNGQSNNNNNNNNGHSGTNANPPPMNQPMTIEQLLTMQTQLMQGMAHIMNNMQQNQNQNQHQNQNQNQGGNNTFAPPRDKRGEFMKGCQPFFSHSADPMQAEDWLKAVEKQLVISQCNDREQVLYGSGQLQGAAQDWWDSYCFAHRDPDTIT